AQLGDRLVAQRARGDGLLDVHEEDGEARGARARLRRGDRAGDQDQVVGALDAGDPDLLAAHHEVVAVAAGLGGDVDGVAARVRLGEGDAGLDLAGGDLRQALALLPRGPVAGEGEPAERGRQQVHERRRAARAALGEGLQGDGELQEALAAAAVLLGDRQAVPAARDQFLPDLLGPSLVRVAAAPVVLVVLPGDRQHALAHRGRALRQVEVHRASLAIRLWAPR